ncbi:hypothetical protein F5X98DRAFT_338762 [Xylaria grammica]|nr:hypothetical protein F5X98DRAFT_338762 [Xylaria grammica]
MLIAIFISIFLFFSYTSVSSPRCGVKFGKRDTERRMAVLVGRYLFPLRLRYLIALTPKTSSPAVLIPKLDRGLI